MRISTRYAVAISCSWSLHLMLTYDWLDPFDTKKEFSWDFSRPAPGSRSWTLGYYVSFSDNLRVS